MDKPGGIAAVILSAGFSSRMGDFKPLLKLGPYTAVEHAVHCFSQAGIEDIRVVTGHRAEEVGAAVRKAGARTVFNSRFAEGMYSSMQAGVGDLGPEADAFFLLPVDQPLVLSGTVEKILNAYRGADKGIVYPRHHGKRGHPPLISIRYRSAILQESAPEGLRGLLRKYERDALDVAVADEAVLLDMDVPEDYQNLLRYFEGRAVPTLEVCRDLLREVGVDEPLWKHCHSVAGLALAFARNVNRAGGGLDEGLVLAGALLHDVAKGQPNHAKAGARYIGEKGYPRVAEVAAVHMDIDVAEAAPVSEAEVVHLADKMVKGDRVVSVSERFAAALGRFQGDTPARQAAAQRREQAERIKKKLEAGLGVPVETIRPVDVSESSDTEVDS